MPNQNRRAFLKKFALGTVYTLGFSFINRVFAGLSRFAPNASWFALIDEARWCPSVHNLQPYKLRINSDQQATLYYDPKRLLPVGDPKSVFMAISMGIFVEHLSIVASRLGKKVEITKTYGSLSAKAQDITPFAELVLVDSSDAQNIDPAWIKKRRTSRNKYDGRVLEEAAIKEIKSEAALFGHHLHHSNEKDVVDFIIRLNQETLFHDISVPENAEELDRLFRYSKKAAKDLKDGLWSRCMGFPGALMKQVFRHPNHWHRGVRAKTLSSYYTKSFEGTSTICWFSGKFENTEDWLTCGRMLARSWLLMTKNNAYIHPFGSLITNEKAYAQINDRLATQDNKDKIWMIFRAGYSDTPVQSYRLNVDDIIYKI